MTKNVFKRRSLFDVITKEQSKSLLPSTILLLFMFYASPSYSLNYFLNVGESITIDSPSAVSSNGYIDQVHVLQTSSALTVTKNADCSVKITVNSYFENTVTVVLRFVEKYTYEGHVGKVDHDVSVNITCKYVKPTSVSLPDVTIAVGSGADIIPVITPNNATITSSSWSRSGSSIGGSARSGHYYHVSARTVGTGTVTVVLNDNDKLTASCKVTVVDPDNMPPAHVSLPESKTLSVGGSVRLTPQLLPEKSSTTFKWSSDNESVATVDYGKVTGKKVGKAKITVKTANGLTASCEVTVSSTGPFDDEPEDSFSGSVDGYDYVDLGLSVKWATYNVGAKNPEENGGYYAWGETSEKSKYQWETYKYGTYMDPVSIGKDIKGTRYDVAYQKWGSNWRMPTEKEVRELYNNCTIKRATKNSIEGYEFIGNNGASIFIPSAGEKRYSSLDKGFSYWTSTLSPTDPAQASSFLITKNRYNEIITDVLREMRMLGKPVRPVTESSGTSTKQQLLLTASPSGGEVEKGTKITLSTDVSGADIYYTLDGITPSKSSSYYTSSITINEDCTLKAIAYKEGYYSSNVLTEYYSIKQSPSIEINETNFPDVNFRNFLLGEKFGQDGIITEEEILEIEALYVYNDVKSLKGIEFFTKLKILSVGFGETSLESLDISNNKELETLSCWYCNLPSIDISKNTLLSELYLYGNPITLLDVSNNHQLRNLVVQSAYLSSLDISKNTSLVSLDCWGNQLTSLDVSNNTLLESLDCSLNHLTSLDLANNTLLTELDCFDNYIKGEGMDSVINSLPTNYSSSENKLYVVGGKSDQNVCTTSQVEVARAKGWIPYAYDSELDKFVEYAGSEVEVNPTSITVLPLTKTIAIGESFTATYSLVPSGATTTVTWYSSDSSIASVDDWTGVVIGLKEGTAYIYAKTSNGLSDYCEVKVKNKSDGFETIGMGTLLDNFYEAETRVEILQDKTNKHIFKILNPYDGITNYVKGSNYKGAKELEITILSPGMAIGYADITKNDLVYFRPINTGYYYDEYESYIDIYHPSAFKKYETEDEWTYNRVISYKNNGWPDKIQLAPYYYISGIGGWDNTQINDVVIITFPSPTDIKDITKDEDKDKRIYDLMGRRLEKPQKGINIIGGKKVYVK